MTVRREETSRGPRIVLPLGGEEIWVSVERAEQLRDELGVVLGGGRCAECDRLRAECNDAADRDAEVCQLRHALTALVHRVERTGGYASCEDQDVLRAAREALAGVSENRPRFAQERAEPETSPVACSESGSATGKQDAILPGVGL